MKNIIASFLVVAFIMAVFATVSYTSTSKEKAQLATRTTWSCIKTLDKCTPVKQG